MEWLREHCSPPLEDEEIAELLTMTGTKVEAIHTLGVREPDRFRVGLVRSVERHPDADRLSVCRVDLGGAEQGEEGLAQIVCGAPNVAAGQRDRDPLAGGDVRRPADDLERLARADRHRRQ